MKKLLTLALLFIVSLTAVAEKINLEIQGSRGKLFATINKPELRDGEKCPIVIIMHGFMGDQNYALLQLIAQKLETAGIASALFDFNGHGQSEGEFQHMTVPNEVEDARNVYNYVRNLPYVSHIAAAGHSQGGVVTSMLAGELRDGLSAIVLMAPAAVLRDDAIRGNIMGATFNPLDPAETVALFGGMRNLGRAYNQTAFSLPLYGTAAPFTGTACIIHGTGDQIVPYTYGQRYHQMWPTSTYHQLDAVDHMFTGCEEKVATIATDYLISLLKK